MAGNSAGALKAAQTMKKRNPNYFKEIGEKGGKKSRGGGFASDIKGSDGMTGKERAVAAGSLGLQSRCHKTKGESK